MYYGYQLIHVHVPCKTTSISGHLGNTYVVSAFVIAVSHATAPLRGPKRRDKLLKLSMSSEVCHLQNIGSELDGGEMQLQDRPSQSGSESESSEPLPSIITHALANGTNPNAVTGCTFRERPQAACTV